ncbi:MAG: hypothetical protein K0R14_1318 [Burkholderiales bacterium]|nr:hypothetical protein [Burkholderiales bacterium]
MINTNNRAYKIIQVVSSADTIENAINLAIASLGSMVRYLAWYKIVETRGRICDNEEPLHVVLDIGLSHRIQ